MGCPPANLSGFRERLHLRVILRYSYAGAGDYFAIIIELKSPWPLAISFRLTRRLSSSFPISE